MSARASTTGTAGPVEPAQRVAVIGGGIAGLAAARRLTELLPGAEVTVFEQAPRVGGKLAVTSLAGVDVDTGAEAMLARRPEGTDLAAALGLVDEVIHPVTTSARVWVGGTARPLPKGTVMGVPGDLAAVAGAGVLSEAALDRCAAEAERSFAPLDGDVSVGDLVADRLGEEVVDRLVEPLLGGVYAGRAHELSLRSAVPTLYARVSPGGSLVAAARESLAAAPSSDAPVFASLRGGLGRLPPELVARSSFAVRTSCAVSGLTRLPSGFRLRVGPARDLTSADVDAVVVALPPGKAALLLRDTVPSAASELRGVATASVAVVSLAYRDVDVPAGSGLLVPASAGRAVKGVTVTSHKWPGFPDGLTLLRASVGRAGDEVVLQRDDAELVALVRHELRTLVGLDSDPIDAHLTRWGGALPQYAVGHVDRVARIQAALDAVPGLAVAGATYTGVGVPACIGTGHAAADRVAAALAARGQ